MFAMRRLVRSVAHKQVAGMIGGLLIGGLGIGIALLMLIYVIEPSQSPELRGLVHYHEGRFVLWYPQDSPERNEYQQLAKTLHQAVDELVGLLQVDWELIPRNIDVFVHPDIAHMQSSIISRKSSQAGSSYAAPLDLFVDDDPRPQLAELVLAFGWGECGSQLLKTGVRMLATEPDRNFHSAIAAMPPRLVLSLSALIRAEETGHFPESIYEQFDSPYSPAMVSFAEMKSLFELQVNSQVDASDIEELEAASLVQYLLQMAGGIREVRRAWGKGSTTRLLQRIDSRSIEELGKDWNEAFKREGRIADDYPYFRVYYLLASGYPDQAWGEAKTWELERLTDKELLLVGCCAVSVGRFQQASEIMFYLEGEDKREQLRQYLELYNDWSVEELPGMRVFHNPGKLSEGEDADSLLRMYEQITGVLELSAADVPERFTIFLYSDESSRSQGEPLTPLSTANNGTLHVLHGENIGYLLAEALPIYAWRREPYSKLLRTGLSLALTKSEQQLRLAGCELRSENRWFPLYRLDFGMADEKTVKAEAALLAYYVLTVCGPQDLQKIWVATSPLDRYLSLDEALVKVCAMTRDDIQRYLFSSFLRCEESAD